jgi:cytidylate kinase
MAGAGEMSAPIPVIAIDGPSASGKGTVAQRVAQALGFHYLDSGALYRLVALSAIGSGTSLDDAAGLAALAAGLPVVFRDGRIVLANQDVTDSLRSEETSVAASRVAAVPAVRTALLERQRAFRRPPGLVADGRDMGSVVFPDALVKVFLTAEVGIRAERRYKQLKEKGMYGKMPIVVEELRQRDARDSARPVAPLKHYPDAIFLDTTSLSIDDAVDKVIGFYRERAHG